MYSVTHPSAHPHDTIYRTLKTLYNKDWPIAQSFATLYILKIQKHKERTEISHAFINIQVNLCTSNNHDKNLIPPPPKKKKGVNAPHSTCFITLMNKSSSLGKWKVFCPQLY